MNLYKNQCTWFLRLGLTFVAAFYSASVLASPVGGAPDSLQQLLEQVKQQRQQEKSELLQREQRFKQAQKILKHMKCARSPALRC